MSTEDFIISWLDSQKGQVQIVNKGTLKKSDISHPDGETILYSDIRSDPEIFKKLEEVVKLNTKSLGRVEVLQLRVANEGLAKGMGMNYNNTSSIAEEEKESLAVPENVVVKSSSKGSNSTSMSGRRNHENESAKLIRDLIVSTQTDLLIQDDENSLNEDGAINNVNNYEISTSSRKKKSKNKNKKSNIIQNELIAMGSDESSENENDESTLDTTGGSSAFSSSSSKHVHTQGMPSKDKNIETISTSNPKKDKKGKKTKRIEKELEIERKEKLEVCLYFQIKLI